MIKGMTGFGSAEFSLDGVKGIIEVKSVNHRYLDIAYYLPTGFAALENKIRELIERYIERGRITVIVKIMHKPAHTIHFNKEAVRLYLKHARMLKKEFGLSGELSLAQLIAMPGVIDTRETALSVEELWSAMEKNLLRALKSLLGMRQREGRSLAFDVQTQLKRMTLQVKLIQGRARSLLQGKRKSLNNEEFFSYQKSADVNEELSRLLHHIEETRLLLKAEQAIGKKIDFIAQEMQRETNTIGSKLQDAVISNAVIALKSKIEKIREQSQNIE